MDRPSETRPRPIASRVLSLLLCRSIVFVLIFAVFLDACSTNASPPAPAATGGPTTMGTYTWSEGRWISRASTAPVAPWIGYDEQQRQVTAIGEPNDGWPGGWNWDGTQWTKSNVSQLEARMTDGGMWYDAMRHGFMLYLQGKTYALAGTAWADVETPSPPSRLNVTLAYDPVRKQALVFGNEIGAFQHPSGNDLTWVWNGSTWALTQPLHQPPNRWSAAMAYDPQLGGIVLFGGDSVNLTSASGGVGVQLSDTWLWNGVDWVQLDSGISLPARTADDPLSTLGFDAGSSTMYLVIGTNGTAILTYAWTSGGWELQKQATGRQVLPDCGLGSRPLRMVYDGGHGYLLLLVPRVRGCLAGSPPANLP
jgi:hypothetical protein